MAGLALSSEEQWLLRIAGARGTPLAQPLPIPDRSFDWLRFLTAAEAHGIVELLAARLQGVDLGTSDAIQLAIAERVIAATGANLARARQAATLLSLLARHDIRALTVKGPAMAVAIFGQLGLRSSIDIDLLVHPDDVSSVRQLLLANGYRLPPRRKHRGGSLIYGIYPGAGLDDTLLPVDGSLAAVDVHVAIAHWISGVRLETLSIIERAVSVDVAGLPILAPCADDLLLVVTLHGMMHGWSQLRYVTDVDAVTAHARDWSQVLRCARSARMRRALSVALRLTRELLDTPLPHEVATVVDRDDGAAPLVEHAKARLFDATGRAADWDPGPWFLAFQASAAERSRYHARRLVYEWLLKWPWDDWLGRRGPDARSEA